ncbi:hypothetical protein HYU06_03370 [Candidatus Woesearchaeota archaeon]|nr:hypothetical protein [Candidatus Woesearchaeota archaeon]
MASDDEGDLLIYSVFGFIFGIYLFFKGFEWLKLKRMVENMPTSKIRSLAMGLVEIYGEVVPAKGHLLKSPFSAHDCVYYKYEIQELRRSKRLTYWATIKSGKKGAYFFLKDNTGQVLTNPADAEIDIPLDFESQTLNSKNNLLLKAFFKSINFSDAGFLGSGRTLKYLEYYIAPKDKLYIMGTAGDNPFVEEGTGIYNAADIMIQKGSDQIYYISDSNEKDLVAKLKRKTFGGLFGGAALSLVCLSIIFIYLGVF